MNIDAFNNYRKKWLGMRVLYYPTKNERKACGEYYPLLADVLKVHARGRFDLHVLCPEGKNFTAKNIPIKVTEDDFGVWDYTEEYAKDYRGK